MDSQRALLWVFCHEACKRILLYLAIIKSSHIKNEFRSSSAAKRRKFDANDLSTEEEYESKLEDLEAELKDHKPMKLVLKKLMKETTKNRQQWIRSSHPSVSDVLESFPLLRKKKYVILMYCSDTLIMFAL